MGIGSTLTLGAGLAAQGLPRLTAATWLLVAWLAAFHTAFSFTLWNHTQRTLAALESSLINNTMTIQIALLAWVFLGEGLTPRAVLGLLIAGAGVLIVQLGGARGER